MPTQHSQYPPAPDYEEIIKGLWPQNAAEVPQLLESNNKYLKKKLTTYSERFGYCDTEIKEKITTDPMFAANFAKDPSRTGIHEKIACDWLAKLDIVENIEKLPTRGKNSMYVTRDGEIRKVSTKHKPSKSLDFRWTSGGYKIYASHKYTKQSGGAQDNQFKDVSILLEHFNKKSEDRKIVLLVIIDGEYYNTQKLEDLHRFCNAVTPFSWALSIGDVPKWLEKHCV